MYCPKCGATVLKGEVTCKKCGASLMEAAEQFHPEEECRSRAMLLFRAWVGAANGSHLRWLGFEDEAAEVASKYGLKKQVGTVFESIFLNPMAMLKVIGIMFYQGFVCIGIIFGMYRTDAKGHPVRWIKKKK